MAAPVVDSNTIVQHYPTLKRKLVITSGNTATAFSHGESYAPDAVEAVCRSGNAAADAACIVTRDTSATTYTADFAGTGVGTDVWEVTLEWRKQATGGVS